MALDSFSLADNFDFLVLPHMQYMSQQIFRIILQVFAFSYGCAPGLICKCFMSPMRLTDLI